jgi:hypothetical protein
VAGRRQRPIKQHLSASSPINLFEEVSPQLHVRGFVDVARARAPTPRIPRYAPRIRRPISLLPRTGCAPTAPETRVVSARRARVEASWRVTSPPMPVCALPQPPGRRRVRHGGALFPRCVSF